MAIGQEMGLEFLLPIAVKRLSADPMAEGDFYPGDLMLKVLRVPIAVWNKSPALRTTRGELHGLLARFFASAEQMNDLWKEAYLADFRAAHRDFTGMEN